MQRAISRSYFLTPLLLAFLAGSLGSSLNKELNDWYYQNINSNMNKTVDPCEDFFGYACGKWAQNYVSTEFVDMAGYMDHKVNKQLLELLQQHKSAGDIYEKLWRYYESCEKLTHPTLNSFLRLVQNDLNITWPIFRDNWNASWTGEKHFDWLATIAGLRWFGLNGVFITQHINVCILNGSHHLLEIHQHQNSYELLEADVAEIFVSFGMTTEESINVTIKIIQLERQMQNLTSLSNKMMEKEELEKEKSSKDQKSSSYEHKFKEFTLADLSRKIKFINWEKYFSIILGRTVNATTEVVQTFDFNYKYFEQLRLILSESSNETISYYIMLKFMYRLNDQLPLVHGEAKQIKCITQLRGYMALAMNFLYEEHIYKSVRNKTDATLQIMYQKLKNNFKQLVAENHLQLDATERAFVLDELDTMTLKIGNVPKRLTRQFVIDYYAKLKLNSSDFYTNHLELLRQHTWHQLESLENKVIPSDLHFYYQDPETSASSSPVKIFNNAILVPYGYLQLPFYNSDLNSLYQYSLLGFILAHEIVHAFDLFHIVFDKEGNYNPMGINVAQHYGPHLGCLAGEGDHLSENIADVSGLRLVYKTYFQTLNASGTDSETFFVNSVQFLCANVEKISEMDLGKLNLEHDMHDTRVQQNWALFEEFSKTFQCKEGSKMSPAIKCRLW